MADRLANDAAHGEVVNRVLDGSNADAGPGENEPVQPRLTHIGGAGEARMVDVGGRDVTRAGAVAPGPQCPACAWGRGQGLRHN